MKLFFVFCVMIGSIINVNLHAQNVGVGTDSPVEFFSVGASSQFRVNASGNLVRINNVQYSFPAVQATSGSVLVNDGSGNLSWTKVTTGNISATGTASNTTFLRGDGSWQTPAGGGSFPSVQIQQTFSGPTSTVTTNLLSGVTVTNAGIYLLSLAADFDLLVGGNLSIIQVDIINNGSDVIGGMLFQEVSGNPGTVIFREMSSIVAALPSNSNLSIRTLSYGTHHPTLTNGKFVVTRLQ